MVRNGLIGLIQQKLLRIDGLVLHKEYPSGVLINMASTDCDNLMSFYWNSVSASPLPGAASIASRMFIQPREYNFSAGP
jgi:hypothetical protein